MPDYLQDGGYHVPFAHKGLAEGLDMRSYASSLHERISIQRVQSADDADTRLSGEASDSAGNLLYAGRSLLRYRTPTEASTDAIEIDSRREIWLNIIFCRSSKHSTICQRHVKALSQATSGFAAQCADTASRDQLRDGPCSARVSSLPHSSVNHAACSAEGREPAYVFVYPNLMINRYGPWMDTNLVLPTGPASCTVRFDWWLDPARCGDKELLQEVRSGTCSL